MTDDFTKLTKDVLINGLKKEFRVTHEFAREFVEAFFNEIKNSQSCTLDGFGKFSRVLKRESNLEKVLQIQKTNLAKYKIKFKTFKSFKDGLVGNKIMKNTEEVKELSIGKIAKILGVEAHTIRFWTNEFESFIPYTLGKGDRRYYNEQSVEVFKRIKDLIHVQGVKIRFIKENSMLSKNYETNVSNAKDDVLNKLSLSLESLVKKLDNF